MCVCILVYSCVFECVRVFVCVCVSPIFTKKSELRLGRLDTNSPSMLKSATLYTGYSSSTPMTCRQSAVMRCGWICISICIHRIHALAHILHSSFRKYDVHIFRHSFATSFVFFFTSRRSWNSHLAPPE